MSTQAPATPRRRIVVGVDGSPSSIDALQWADTIAGLLHAEITAVTAWEYPVNYGIAGVAAVSWDPAADAAPILATALTAAFGHHPPLGIRSTVGQGHAARVLLDAAHDAEMLVVGSRGHGGFTGMLLGSVSASCAEHAPCPVLVTRAKPPVRTEPTPDC